MCNFKILGGCWEVNSYIRELHGNPEHPIIVFADSTTINIDIRKKTEKYSNLHITQIGCLEYYIFNYTPFRNIALSVGKGPIWDETVAISKTCDLLSGMALDFWIVSKYNGKTTEQQITDIYRAIMNERSCTNCTKKKYIKIQDAEASWKEKHTATHAFMNNHCDDESINNRMCSRCYSECPHIGITRGYDNLVDWFNSCGIRYSCGIDILNMLNKELILCTT